MDSLVDEALAFYEEHPDPIPAAEAAKNEADEELSNADSISEDEEGVMNLPEDLRQIGCEMKEALLDGREISDELYVRVFVNKLNQTYEYKDPRTKRREAREVARKIVDIDLRLSEIDTEIDTVGVAKKRVKALLAEEE